MRYYKIQKWIRGWGWTTIGEVPNKEQAEQAIEIGRQQGYRMRIVEECGR